MEVYWRSWGVWMNYIMDESRWKVTTYYCLLFISRVDVNLFSNRLYIQHAVKTLRLFIVKFTKTRSYLQGKSHTCDKGNNSKCQLICTEWFVLVFVKRPQLTQVHSGDWCCKGQRPPALTKGAQKALLQQESCRDPWRAWFSTAGLEFVTHKHTLTDTPYSPPGPCRTSLATHAD